VRSEEATRTIFSPTLTNSQHRKASAHGAHAARHQRRGHGAAGRRMTGSLSACAPGSSGASAPRGRCVSRRTPPRPPKGRLRWITRHPHKKAFRTVMPTCT
jgi:hypothetical protein